MTPAHNWTVTMSGHNFSVLHRHLIQDDQREHAAFLLAGYTTDNRLLVRDIAPIPDNAFISRGGHYEVTPAAVAGAAHRAARERLALIWAHSHPGSTLRVGFSGQDHATIDRAHPALVDITEAPVGALVFGEDAVAGEVLVPGGGRASIGSLRVLGSRVFDLDDGGRRVEANARDVRHARQILLFGDTGQRRLRSTHVAVLGAGGGGSLIVQLLAHLGVGEICIVDFDRVASSNLSRIVGATSLDVLLRRRKVRVARRLVRRIDRRVKVKSLVADAADVGIARKLAAYDAIFVATDTALGRHAANAVAYQYMIPMFVVGAKVQADPSGAIETIHTVVRIGMPGVACLHCQGAIPAARLHAEQLSDAERRAQDYLGGGEDVEDPSVISLNGISASAAVTDFLLMFCGLMPADADLSPVVWYPLERRAARRPTPSRSDCIWCTNNPSSALGRGDTWPLSLRQRMSAKRHSAGALKWIREVSRWRGHS